MKLFSFNKDISPISAKQNVLINCIEGVSKAGKDKKIHL